MAIVNEKLDSMNKELQTIEKQIDSTGSNYNDVDLIRQRKNLKERIRVLNNKLIDEQSANAEQGIIKVPVNKVEKPVNPSKSNIKDTVTLEYKAGKNAKEIVEMYGYKVKSVRWYIWKINQTN